MKKLRNTLISAAITASLASCVVMQPTSITKEAKSTDVNGLGVTHVPVITDLVISETKVSGTYSSGEAAASWDYVKEMAIANALGTEFDLLIEPSYELRTEGSQKTAIVKGFPARYKNFRNIDLNSVQSNSNYSNSSNNSNVPANGNGINNGNGNSKKK